MSRKPGTRYPSDDARLKTRPHLKVHLSARSHRRYRKVFEDLEGRAIIWGLWLVAVQYHAAQTDNEVALGPSDLCWISGRSRSDHARKAVIRWLKRMSYEYSYDGHTLVVNVRNLKRKQGFAPTDRGDTPPSIPTSDTEVPNTLPSEEGAEPPRAPPAKSPWLNLLKGKPPNGYASAEDWLDEHLPIVEGEADKQLGKDADSTQRNGAIKALLCRYWRNKSGPRGLAQAKAAAPKHPDRKSSLEVCLEEDAKLRTELGRDKPKAREPPEAEAAVSTAITASLRSVTNERG